MTKTEKKEIPLSNDNNQLSARNILDYTKKEKYKINKDSEVIIDASEHISDWLCSTDDLMRKPGYSRYNSQSDLGNYAISTSSLVRVPGQKANPSHEQIIYVQYPELISNSINRENLEIRQEDKFLSWPGRDL